VINVDEIAFKLISCILNSLSKKNVNSHNINVTFTKLFIK
jgi:hypothetical protein